MFCVDVKRRLSDSRKKLELIMFKKKVPGKILHLGRKMWQEFGKKFITRDLGTCTCRNVLWKGSN